MTSSRLLLFFFLLFVPVQLFSQSGDDERERKDMIRGEMKRYQNMLRAQESVQKADDQFDVKYYLLDIAVTASPNYLSGRMVMKARMTAASVDSIRLDLMSAMTIDSMFVDTVPADWDAHAENFDIYLPHTYHADDSVTVEVYYRGVPGSSGFGSFEYSLHGSPNVPYIWSLSEPYGAKDWWPCKDHPLDKADSADVYVTVASAYKVGSNGLLVSVTDNGNGTKTHHWHESYPISTYLISVAITNYSEFTNWWKYSPTDSMPILNYVLPEHLANAQANLPRVAEMIQIYSDLYGLYPFRREKYGHSEFGWGGGMEHETMTSLSSFGESLVAHELAHQWFGDMITCSTWPDIWLNEGFATYSEALYGERKYGALQYGSLIQNDMLGGRAAQGSIHVVDTSNVGTLFSSNLVYSKAASVLHMLRHVVGDSTFFHSMRRYANDPRFQYGTASTEDFRSVFEAESGMDLGWFFQQWIYGEKYPHYKIFCTAGPAGGGMSAVAVNVRQTTGTTNPSFFTMPVDIRFAAFGWDTTIKFQNTVDNQTFNANLPFKPTTIQFDPKNWLLKTIDSLYYISVPDTIDLGSTNLTLSHSDTLTIGNSGSSGIIVSSVTVDSADFSITPASASITSGSKKTFIVTFTPTKAGLRRGTITILHNGIPSPLTVAVRGFGLTPTLTAALSADSIDFGHVVVSRSRMDSVTVTNTGNGMLTVSSITIDSAGFTCSPSSFTLGPAGSKVVRITFAPWRTGPYSGLLSVAHNGIDSPAFAKLAGYSEPWNSPMHVLQNWNIVSLPVATADSSIDSLFPGAISSAYAYNGSTYVPSTLVSMGKGYWLKFGSSHDLTFDGTPVQRDTLELLPGWNLIGSLHQPIAISQLVTIPPGAINSSVYGYAAGYFIADTIQPGRGYWLKSSQAAQLVLSSASGSSSSGLSVQYPVYFPSTSDVRYTLAAETHVNISLYNAQGDPVLTAVDEIQSAGVHTVLLRTQGLAKGVYFCRVSAGRDTDVKTLLIK